MGKEKPSFNEDFLEEYRAFLEKYLLPILGIADGKVKLLPEDERVGDYDDNIYFYNNSYWFIARRTPVASFYYPSKLIEDDLSLSKNIINAFFSLSEYRMVPASKETKLKDATPTGTAEGTATGTAEGTATGTTAGTAEVAIPRNLSDVQKEIIYRMAVQKGICDWIIGSNNPAAERLMNELERWSVQTYEGKKVSFGFVVNEDATEPPLTVVFDGKVNAGDWLTFMDSDYAAVLTDGIHSVIELNKDCNMTQYLSLARNDGRIPGFFPRDDVPLRFANVIQIHVTGAKVGIFLLVNGDIVIAKHSQVKLVKRNLKWLNLSLNAFINAIEGSESAFVRSLSSMQRGKKHTLVSSIYASVLDVSFSHTGGIIAVVNSNDLHKTEDFDQGNELPSLYSILAKNDILTADIEDSEIQKEFAENGIKDAEQNKRLLKRTVLRKLVADKKFMEIDRKLRNELISWDGACIIDENGQVISFGAIIRNEKGSSEGGRGAAAKSLSRYGMAIKISTDGYIELFVNGEEKPSYSIK